MQTNKITFQDSVAVPRLALKDAAVEPRQGDPISSWFLAAEELDEFIGIRFGQLRPGTTEPQWTFLRHALVDGIGGFAEILRSRGAELARLPQIKHPATPSLLPMLRTWLSYLAPRRRLALRGIEGPRGQSSSTESPKALAWHCFDENTTIEIRKVCRKSGVTVNSFLLKHLTKAIRPSLVDESSCVPWMLPVNMRGKVRHHGKDSGNYSSYIGLRVSSFETSSDIHRNIYATLARGEHWANWYSYGSGRFLSRGLKKLMLRTEKCTSQWSIGAFSNLGDWDPDKQIQVSGCAGPWFFCAPVLRFQQLSAGCVTFQNQLSLTLQAHPELTLNSRDLQGWMTNWVKEIELDIASILPD